MKRILTASALCLALAACEDSSSTAPPAASTPETRLVGKWAPVINSYGHYWDFRSTSGGVVHLRGWVNDSSAFTYTASGGAISMHVFDGDGTGTYRFFGNDSVELKIPSSGIGYLMTRIQDIPAP